MSARISIDTPRPDVLELARAHRAWAAEHSPPEDVHAVEPEALLHPGITLLTARGADGELLAMGALRDLGGGHAELKAMHVRAAARGAGLGRALLDELVLTARQRGFRRLSLETGTMEAFASARALYARAGFVTCPPFGDYTASPHSTWMTLPLDGDARADRAAHLDAVLIGGREPVTITIVDHDEAWSVRFAQLRRLVQEALGDTARGVEHIGSTSVPGLAAKPIVDALLTVASVEDEDAYVPPLVAAGLVLRVREPGHRLLRTPGKDVHLHVYEPEHPAVADYLDLRDWLRVSAADRALYADTKRALAQRAWVDMNDYADAKTDVVLEVLGRARQWRRRDR